MKKLILLTISGLLLGCFVNLAHSIHAGGGTITTGINTTIGQELIDLQQALDSSAITQEEYDELKLKIMERLDASIDSTDTSSLLE